IAARRVPDKLLEASRERFRVLEPDSETDIEHGIIRHREQQRSFLEPYPLDVLLRRLADDPREQAMEVERRRAELPGQLAQLHVLDETIVEIDQQRQKAFPTSSPLLGGRRRRRDRSALPFLHVLRRAPVNRRRLPTRRSRATAAPSRGTRRRAPERRARGSRRPLARKGSAMRRS